MSKRRVIGIGVGALLIVGAIGNAVGGGGTAGKAATPIPVAAPAPTSAPPPTQRPASTATPRPAPTPVARPASTAASIQPTSAPAIPASAPAPATAPKSGGPVSEAEGEYVTSSASNATNYYTKGQRSKWEALKAENRVWFKTLDDLQAAYPGRKAGN